jgi:uncharacterized membrane protein YfcA
MDPSLLTIFFLMAFLCELMDTSIGGGYGTILVPFAVSLGTDALIIIPAVLFSEICTGFLGGFFHNRFKNIDFRIVGLDFILGFVGITIGVLTGISIPPRILNTWIGLIVFGCGILMLFTLKERYIVKGDFKLRNDIPLTLMCSFNKGISGGGYGPVSTAGLIAVKAHPKKAVGSTILSEGIVCLMGFSVFAMVGKASIQLNPLTICITIAACLATLPAAYITQKVATKRLKLIIAGFILCLGVYTLVKALL